MVARRIEGVRSRALIEVSLMAALLLSYIWIWQDAFSGHFLVVAALYFSLGYWSHRFRGEGARRIGLRMDNWRRAAQNVMGIVVAVLVVSVAAGALWGSLHFPPAREMPLRLALLVLWGTAQQYGLLCFFYRRLLEILGQPLPATASAAMLFALFHLPNPFLTVVTLGAGWISCILYRREPNVFVIGAAHAVISFTLYYALPEGVTRGLRVGPGN